MFDSPMKKREHISIFDFKKWTISLLKFKYKILIAVILFVLAGIMNYYIGNYLDNFNGPVAKDFLLDRIPALPVGWLFVGGIFFFIGILLAYPLFFRLEDFSYTFNQWTFMILVRNLFMILTPLSVSPAAAPLIFPALIEGWNFNNDLFFSGHAVVPMIGYLTFKDSKIRYLFLIGIFVMGAVALMTHRHYSIDVFAGLFIGYGCYKIYDWISKKSKISVLQRK